VWLVWSGADHPQPVAHSGPATPGTPRPRPLGGNDGERVEGMPQRFADHLDPVQGPHGRQNMGGVRPLPSPRFDEATVAAPCEEPVKQERFRRPSQQVAATCAEDRRIEPGVRELQAQDIFPVDTAAYAVGRLAIRQPSSELQQRHQHQPPGRQRGLSVPGKERQKASSVNNASNSSASRRSLCPLGNAAWATRAVSGRRAQSASGEAWYPSTSIHDIFAMPMDRTNT
jgi:hypothetical protein